MSQRLMMQRRRLKENSEFLKEREQQQQRSVPFGVNNSSQPPTGNSTLPKRSSTLDIMDKKPDRRKLPPTVPTASSATTRADSPHIQDDDNSPYELSHSTPGRDISMLRSKFIDSASKKGRKNANNKTPALSSSNTSINDRSSKPPSGRNLSSVTSHKTVQRKDATPVSLSSALPPHKVASVINGAPGLSQDSSVMLSQDTAEPARQLRFGDGSTAKKPPPRPAAAGRQAARFIRQGNDDSSSSSSSSSSSDDDSASFARLFRKQEGLPLTDEKSTAKKNSPPSIIQTSSKHNARASALDDNNDNDYSATEHEEETQPIQNITKRNENNTAKDNRPYSSEEEQVFQSKKRRASTKKRVVRRQQLADSSSDSDSSGGLARLFAEQKRAAGRVKQQDKEVPSEESSADASSSSRRRSRSSRKSIKKARHGASRKREPAFSSEESSLDPPKSLQAVRRKPKEESTRHHRYRTYESTSESSSSPSSESEDDSRARRNNDKSLMADTSDEEPWPKKKAKKKKSKTKASTAHNPLVLERLEREKQAQLLAHAIAKKANSPGADDDDDLWSDDDEVVAEKRVGNGDEDGEAGKKKRKRSQSKSSSGTKRSGMKKKPRSSDASEGTRRQQYLLYKDDKERMELLKMDPNKLRDLLQPNFPNPRFGPFSLDPLTLTGESGATHEVPSSMSRYLLSYQRKGIKFMHNSLTANKGVILGDDMGLGKTVQVLSLLAALFEKTGTGADLLELARRRELVETQMAAKKKQEEEALLNGFDMSCDLDIDKEELKLSSWSPTMIMVPSSVVENWKNEFKTWVHFEVAVYEGNNDNKDSAFERVKAGLAEIMLVPHSIFKQNPASNSHLEKFLTIPWKLVVVDEFHVFKNDDTHGSKNLRQLKKQHRCLVLGMTGTPMQNHHKELWNIVDLAETGYLGTWDDFELKFSIPIKNGRAKNADESTIEKSIRKANVLAQKMTKILLSRTKEIVLANELPEKNEKFVLCELSPLQKSLYEHILSLPDFEIIRTAIQPCNCPKNARFFQLYNRLQTTAERLDYYRKNKGSVEKRSQCCYKMPLNEDGVIDPRAAIWRTMDGHAYDKDTGEGTGCKNCPTCAIFPSLTKLYKLSSHVALLQPKKADFEEGSKEHLKFLKDLEFAKVAFPEDKIKYLAGGTLQREDGMMDDHFALSGKMKVMDSLLRKFSKENSRVLIFSYSTQTLDFIENYIKGRHQYLRMDGSTNSKDRQKIADQFRADPTIFAFLLSTKAMGLGLNLCEANKVIIFDVEWNPSWDQQAQDRAYRIGQKQDVDVYRLIAQGTIDEIKFLRQMYKVQLKQETLKTEGEEAAQVARIFRGIQDDPSSRGELFGAENLLKYKDGSFLNDIWKKSGRQRSSGGNIMNADEVNEAMLKIGKEYQDVIDENSSQDAFSGPLKHIDALAQESVVAAEQKIDSDGWSKRQSNRATKSLEEEQLDFGENEIDHDDLFKNGGGRASLKGENGMDEEMGQASQDIFNMSKGGVFDCFGDGSDEDEAKDEAMDQGDLKPEALGNTGLKHPSSGTQEQQGTNFKINDTNEEAELKRDQSDALPLAQRNTDVSQGTSPVVEKGSTVEAPSKKKSSRKSSSPKDKEESPLETSFQLGDLMMPSYASKKKKRKKKKSQG